MDEMTEKEAYEMGFRCVHPNRGPKSPLQKWMEENCSDGTTALPVHPLSTELLGEVFERVPEHLRESVAKGFMAGLLGLADDARKARA